jgi:hypothetical protein
VVAGDMTTQPKQGRQAMPMSCLFIHLFYDNSINLKKYGKIGKLKKI